MAEFVFNEINLSIDTVRNKSRWGRQQSLEDYRHYIFQEKKELDFAIKLDDKINIIEELADVYMMIYFYWQESNEIYMNINERKYYKLFQYIKNKTTDYNLTIDNLEKIICNKLQCRYPILLSNQLSFLEYEDIDEEYYWKIKKYYYKIIEFCTCSNKRCSNYHKLYDGSNLNVYETKSGKSYYIFCSVCQKRISLKESFIFYGVNNDYKIILKAILEYIISKDEMAICKKYNISQSTLKCLNKKISNNIDVFEALVKSRYGIDFHNRV